MSNQVTRRGFLGLLLGSAVSLALPEAQAKPKKLILPPKEKLLENGIPIPNNPEEIQRVGSAYYGTYTKFPTGVYGVSQIVKGEVDLVGLSRQSGKSRLAYQIVEAMCKHYMEHPEEWFTDTGNFEDACPFLITPITTKSLHDADSDSYHETYTALVMRKPGRTAFINESQVGELFAYGYDPQGTRVRGYHIQSFGVSDSEFGTYDLTHRHYPEAPYGVYQLTSVGKCGIPTLNIIEDSGMASPWKPWDNQEYGSYYRAMSPRMDGSPPLDPVRLYDNRPISQEEFAALHGGYIPLCLVDYSLRFDRPLNRSGILWDIAPLNDLIAKVVYRDMGAVSHYPYHQWYAVWSQDAVSSGDKAPMSGDSRSPVPAGRSIIVDGRVR